MAESMTLAAAYEHTEPIIYNAVRKHLRRWGGDWDDALSEATYHFTIAYHVWIKKRGDLDMLRAIVHRRVSLELIEAHRKRQRELQRIQRKAEMERPVIPFDVDEFVGQLSADAQTAVRLILETPRSLARVMDRDVTPSAMRTCLREYLYGLGWSAQRVRECFQEIRSKL